MQYISYLSCCRDHMSTSKLSMVKNGLSTKVCIFDLFLNWSPSSIIRDIQLIFIFLSYMAWQFSQNLYLFWMPFQNQKTMKEFHHSSCLYKIILSFLYTIYKHCKWITPIGPAFINESGNIKTLKIIARTVDFGIPTLEKFLIIKRFWRTVGII